MVEGYFHSDSSWPFCFHFFITRWTWERCESPEQRHRGVRSASAAPPGAPADAPSASLPDSAHQTARRRPGRSSTLAPTVTCSASLQTPQLLLMAAGTRKDARWMLESSKTEGCVSVALSYFTSTTKTPQLQLSKRVLCALASVLILFFRGSQTLSR